MYTFGMDNKLLYREAFKRSLIASAIVGGLFVLLVFFVAIPGSPNTTFSDLISGLILFYFWVFVGCFFPAFFLFAPWKLSTKVLIIFAFGAICALGGIGVVAYWKAQVHHQPVWHY